MNLQTRKRSKRKVQAVRFVYFIEAVTLGMVKIGSADDPRRRLSALRTACPDELRLVGVMAAEDARDLEARLHTKFATQRRRGEWFEPDDEMRRFMTYLSGEELIDDTWILAGDPNRPRLDCTSMSELCIREDVMMAELADDDDSYPKPELEQLTAVINLRRAGWTPRRILKASRSERVTALNALMAA